LYTRTIPGWAVNPAIGTVIGEIADSRAAHLAYFCARRRYFLILEKQSHLGGRAALRFDWKASDSEYKLKRRNQMKGAWKWMSRKDE
jgi:hypothetical protein